MAGGPVVSKEIKERIASLKMYHPDWKYERIRAELGKQAPSLSYIQKLLGNYPTTDESDTPWHLGYMREINYAIPAESIPYILEAQEWAKETNMPAISIRQAKWIARLYAVAALKDGESVWRASYCYTVYEKISDAAGTSTPVLDTSKFDSAIQKGLNELIKAASWYLASEYESKTGDKIPAWQRGGKPLSGGLIIIDNGFVSVPGKYGVHHLLGKTEDVIPELKKSGILPKNTKTETGNDNSK